MKNFILKFKKWIITCFLGSAVLAGGLANLPEQIPNDLKLKCDKTDIIKSNEYTEYKYKKDEQDKYILDKQGKKIIKSQKQIVNYSYKSDELVPAFKNEIIEKRTNNIVTRDLGGGKRSAQSGYDFYKENGQWKKIKYATTTPEVFNKVSLLNSFIALATDTGVTSPGTMASINDPETGNDKDWTNVDNVKVSDNNYAYISNFSGSEGEGIFKRRVSLVKDSTIETYDHCNSCGSIPSTEAYVTWGNDSDLWNTNWSYSDINDSNFGVIFTAASGDYTSYFLQATNFGFSVPINATINGIEVEIEMWADYDSSPDITNVDHIRITVYYTAVEEETFIPQILIY